jgi:thiopeptide-type bacteriocin biosynthesis protein
MRDPNTHEPRFFVLRSPLLPVDVLVDVFGGKEDDVGFEETSLEILSAREQHTRSRVAAIAAEPHVREAIFIASPSLDGAIDAWQRQPDGEAGRKIALAVLRYIARMSSRSTPFGLFSAVSFGQLGDHTSLRAESIASCRPHARIDSHVLCTLIDVLMNDEATAPSLKLVTTPSLYECAGRLRYARISLSDPKVAFPLVDAAPNAALLAVLESANEPATRDELVAALRAARPNTSEVAARDFVDRLAEHALLVPAATPAMTGPEPARPLIEALRAEPPLVDLARRLEEATDALEHVGGVAVGEARPSYERALAVLDTLPVRVESVTRIQVDLVRPLAERSLGPLPARELLRVATLLRDYAPPSPPEELARFRERFEARFEGREVPLLQALDDEHGVHLGDSRNAENTELLRDLPLGQSARKVGTWTEGDARLADQLHGALRSGATEIELAVDGSKADRTALPFPASFAAMATIHGSAAEIDAGDFLVERPAFVTPVTALLGRFCHASPEIHDALRELIAEEEALASESGTIIADVVNLTLGRFANIQLRPQLHAWEIVCHGRSAAPSDRQIPASDLLVSVQDGKVILRSKRLGKRIVPSIPSAYDASRDAAVVYRFLDSLQRQDSGMTAGFNWGALENSEYLPAVRSGRTILESQLWNLSRARLLPVIEAKGPLARYRALAALREALRIPRWVAVVSLDNFIPLDLDNPLAIDLLLQALTSSENGRIALREFSRERLASKALSMDGRALLHEIVVPFSRRSPANEVARVAPAAKTAEPTPVARSFAPGSTVLYASIYGMSSRFDELVANVLQPLAARARAKGTVSKWFFVRYADPADHLRVRFFGDASLWTSLLPELHEALRPILESNAAWRVTIDTYEREIERYGGPVGITLAEDLFSADSEASAALLSLLEKSGEEPNDRWQLVALGWDALLRDFSVELAGRHDLARSLAQSYLREHGGSKELEHALGQRWRELGRSATALLQEEAPSEPPLLAEARRIYRARSTALESTIAAIKGGIADGSIHAPLDELLASYLHMSADRLFSGTLRAQELVVWELMSRAYRGAAARKAPK